MNTIRLRRVVCQERFIAISEAEAMAKWLPPNGFTGKVHHGCEGAGAYKISFTNFTTGKNSLARKHQVKGD
jgi:hypothetical protein